MRKKGKFEKVAEAGRLIPLVETHMLRHTALCDDGSAYFVPVSPDGMSVLGEPVLLTLAKMRALAKLRKPTD